MTRRQVQPRRELSRPAPHRQQPRAELLQQCGVRSVSGTSNWNRSRCRVSRSASTTADSKGLAERDAGCARPSLIAAAASVERVLLLAEYGLSGPHGRTRWAPSTSLPECAASAGKVERRMCRDVNRSDVLNSWGSVGRRAILHSWSVRGEREDSRGRGREASRVVRHPTEDHG